MSMLGIELVRDELTLKPLGNLIAHLYAETILVNRMLIMSKEMGLIS